MSYRQTTTETTYDSEGRVTKVTITEKDYPDGGPVRPSQLPTWHPWYERDRGLGPVIVGDNPNHVPAVTSGDILSGPNSVMVELSPQDRETIARAAARLNSTDRATRVTGE